MNNLDELIEDQLTPMIQDKWEELIKGTNISSMDIPVEHVALMRILYQLGYQAGNTDTFTQLKDVYNNDVDGFIEIFEES